MSDVAASGSPSTRRAAVGYALVAIASSSWGLWPLFLRRAEAAGPLTTEIESATALATLTIFSGIMMTRDRLAVRKPRQAWIGVTWLGLSDAINVVLYFRAIQLTTVAVAALTHYLTPLFVALAAPLFLRERVSKRTFGAVGIAFAGLVMLLEPWRGGFAGSRMLVGAMFGAGSAVFYASNVLFNKRLSTWFSGSELSFFHGLVAVPAVCLLVPRGAWLTVTGTSWLWLLAGSVGPGACGGLLFVWGLRRIPAAHASALTLLEPFVAVCVGMAMFGEALTAMAMAGGVLVLLGAAMVVSPRSRQSVT